MGNESDAVMLVEQYIYGLTCCFDMGWQWCTSGRNYNSMSGHAFLVRANSNKILMRVCYSKSCCTCWCQKRKRMEKQWQQKGEFLEYNKPMTKTTAVCTALMNLWSQWKQLALLLASLHCLIPKKLNAGILCNDDSSMHANCKHSFQVKITAEIWSDKASCWPKKNGSYLKDHGKLLLHVPEIKQFLADPTHCCKCFGKDLFKLVEERDKELAFNKIDCAHLKWNFSYCLCQNCNETFEVFKYCFPCIVKHNFNNHEFCMGRNEGGWCKYKGDMALLNLKTKQKNCYHDKDQEPAHYTALIDILKQFSTDKMLMQSWHPYWIQKRKLLNQLVSVFAHKDKHLWSSVSLSDHVALVVIMDSVRYAK